MKTLILSTTITLLGSICSASSYIGTRNVTGCSFWMFNSIAGSYVCNNPDISVPVPNAGALQNIINNLEQKNSELEQRILRLESKIP